MESGLPIWVIYKHPRDFPSGFVVRRQVARRGGVTIDKTAIRCASLDEARRAIPPGLVLLSRMQGDDPVIVETWV